MKNTSAIYALLVSAAIFAGGCKKLSPPPVIAAGMTASVNDTAFSAQIYYAGIDTGTKGELILNIYGYDTIANKQIVLKIDNYEYFGGSAENTYDIGNGGISATYTSSTNGFGASSGVITLYRETGNSNVEGYFSFTSFTFAVTKGTFNVPFQ